MMRADDRAGAVRSARGPGHDGNGHDGSDHDGTGHRDDRAYVVLVGDPLVAELDAYGPMSRAAADALSRRIDAEFESFGFPAVVVTVVALAPPR